MFDESKHKRDDIGRFAKSSDGAGGIHEATPAEKKRLSELGIDKKQTLKKIELSKQEYAVLRKEVMRKNSAQKGKVKPINFAFTANYFYVYLTSGNDSLTPLVQLDIEIDGDKIDAYLDLFRGD